MLPVLGWAAVRRLRQEYGTTDEDLDLWEQFKRDIQYTAMPEILALIPDLEVMRIRDGTAVLGAWAEPAWRRPQHPGTAKVVSRALGQVAGTPVELEAVAIQGVKTDRESPVADVAIS